MRKDDLAIEFQKIDEEVVLLDRLIMIKTQRSLDSIELRAAAFSITSIYNGLEKMVVSNILRKFSVHQSVTLLL
ncbi:hypothetical protein [Spirochaeta africana]|uniref:Uncharacterized protein n=1 Tax=Spirochaeta africana (strain ATCC 700263 / DSM 8902 / Z-7692) TaxID=889378 RepID=H9UH62_SPIAZ|nr:hypothetical protein [Spirochaeta africana]AFG36855.1 hypothetical protein Spiaf_0760 [Spirochaeta africana DSM 8902]